MVRVIKSSTETKGRQYTATTSKEAQKRNFTPTEVVELLQAIDELKGLEIFYEKASDGNLQFVIGDKVYRNIPS